MLIRSLNFSDFVHYELIEKYSHLLYYTSLRNLIKIQILNACKEIVKFI